MTAILVISFSMAITALMLRIQETWTTASLTSTFVGAIVALAWVIWIVYILCKKKTLKELPLKPRLFIELLSSLAILFWAYIVSYSTLTTIFFALIVALNLYFDYSSSCNKETNQKK